MNNGSDVRQNRYLMSGRYANEWLDCNMRNVYVLNRAVVISALKCDPKFIYLHFAADLIHRPLTNNDPIS